MAVHHCSKEEDIAVMKFKLDEIHRALMGNGQKGLLEKWHNLEGSLLFFKGLSLIAGAISAYLVIKPYLP